MHFRKSAHKRKISGKKGVCPKQGWIPDHITQNSPDQDARIELVCFFLILNPKLKVKFCCVCSQVPNKAASHQFEVEGVAVDLKTGTLTVAADNDEVVQNLCLAFSVAVLQVSLSLCKKLSVSANVAPCLFARGAAQNEAPKNGDHRMATFLSCGLLTTIWWWWKFDHWK